MRINRSLDVQKVFVKTLKKSASDLKYGILDRLNEISVFLQIAGVFLFWQNERLSIIHVFLLSCLLTAFTRFLTAFHRAMQGKSIDDIPVPSRRFTTCNKAGFIEVRQEEGVEITKYLYDIEEFLEKKGLLKNDSSL